MPTLHAGYTNKQIGEKGREIYERKIRHLVEPKHIGEYVVIDVDTEEYEVDQDDMAAALRLREKHPEGARYGMRIGYRTLGLLGLTAAQLDC